MTVEKLKMHSPDLTERNIDKIAELFPSAITEKLDDAGNPIRAVDFDLLRQELSDHVVEGPQERYQLDWPGKAPPPSLRTLPLLRLSGRFGRSPLHSTPQRTSSSRATTWRR